MALVIDPRSLSPITELTTPGSLRTNLPNVDHLCEAYESEHESGSISPDGSIYSAASAETVRNAQPILDSLPDPTRPPRSPKRPAPLVIKSRDSLVIPPVPSPRSLPPPPRPNALGRTPPPSPNPYNMNGESWKRWSDRSNGVNGEDAGMAGVGAGSVERILAVRQGRPNSVNGTTPRPPLGAGDIAAQDDIRIIPSVPALVSRHSDLTLHGIPYLPESGVEGWASPSTRSSPSNTHVKLPTPNGPGSRTPNGSRPNSLKKKRRPNSYHGRKSNDLKLSTVSKAEGKKADLPMTAGCEADEISHPASGDRHETPHEVTTAEPHSEPPPNATHSSDSSTRSPAEHDTARRRRSPPRRRLVSSIFSSLFGTDTNGSVRPRRLSLHRRQSAHTRNGLSGDSTASAEIGGDAQAEVETAIRTSGTFGIRDDGSERYAASEAPVSPASPRPAGCRRRTTSHNGSVQSTATQRVLYVKNVDEPSSEGAVAEICEQTPESPGSSQALYTPHGFDDAFDALARPVMLRSQSDAPSPLIKPPRPTMGHRRSFSPPSARSATFVPLGSPLPAMVRPLTPPPSIKVARPSTFGQMDILPSPAGSRISQPASAFVPIVEHGEMVDQGMQTSPKATVVRAVTGPTKGAEQVTPPLEAPDASSNSTPNPLPRTPSGPRLNVPPPPSASPSPQRSIALDEDPKEPPVSSPAPELPLLVASHLLSSHAAALMKHSTSMREISEEMYQMAQESLDWGGVLLGMGQRSTHSSRPASFQAPPRARPTPIIDGLPTAGMRTSDPLAEAWLKLNGLAPPVNGQAMEDENAGRRDGFTPIPERPTVTRQRSRQEMTQHEELRDSLPPLPTISRPQRHESLPADWLNEADRLGREGWQSLRRAEDAWNSAMYSLKEIVERPEVIREEATLRTQGATRSRHASLDLRPRSYDQHGDMPGPRRSGDLSKAERLLGPNAGIDLAIASLYPEYRTNGYAQDQMGWDTVRPPSRTTNNTNTTTTDRDRMTQGTGALSGRKLSKVRRGKVPPIPSEFRQQANGQAAGQSGTHGGAAGGVGQTVASMGTYKKHWWSRKRSESAV